jgi:hypothetical protein
MTSEIRISRSRVALSLAHNQLDPTRHICGAEWAITVPVSWPRVYYGDRWVEEPWWARLGRYLLLDRLGWLVALGYNTVVSIVVSVVYNIFQTASGSASATSSNGLYTVRWIKGWAKPPPPTVVVTEPRVPLAVATRRVEILQRGALSFSMGMHHRPTPRR